MSLVLALKNLFPSPPDSEALMEQYRLTQQPRYIEQLYKVCAKDLYCYMLAQANSQLAQEVCQLTWLRVIERRHSYRSSGSFKGWLFAIARNLLIDELRRSNRWSAETEHELVSEQTDTSYPEAMSNLNEALDALPFHQREAIVLQQEGFGLAEIAQITGSEIEAVKSRLRYGKAKLKTLWRLENV